MYSGEGIYMRGPIEPNPPPSAFLPQGFRKKITVVARLIEKSK